MLTIVTGGLLVMMLAGVPIAFALLLAGVAGLLTTTGFGPLAPLLSDAVYDTVSSYALLTIPMFVLMSEYLAASGMARDIIHASDRWLGRLPGGMGIACVLASSLLAAVIGSSTASAAAMSRAAYPGMRKLGYSDAFSTGIIAIAGTLAIMIPPSIVLVIYGIITEVSVGKLLVAGILPGLLTAVGYGLVIFGWALLKPDAAPRGLPFQLGPALRASVSVWPVLVLMVLVMGALYAGIATANEVGAVGAVAALALVFGMRRLDGKGAKVALANTMQTTCMVVSIIFGAVVFGYFLTSTQFTQNVLAAVSHSGMPSWAVLLLVVGIYLVLGMFLDQIAILVLTVPVTFPLITALGYDGVWFGIIVTKTVEIGLVTPPLGLNVFITSKVTGVPLPKAFVGVLPFIIIELVLLALLIVFPQISLLLPSMMK